MRTLGFPLIFAFLLLAGTATAGTCPDPASSAQRALVVGQFDPGTRLTATLRYKITSHHAWYSNSGFMPNPKVVASIDYDLVCNGQVLIPKGSKLLGSIRERNSMDSSHLQSKLGIVFERLDRPGQKSLYFTSGISALAAPSSPPLDVASTGVSGLAGLELDYNGTIVSSRQTSVTLSAGTRIVVSVHGLLPGMQLGLDLEKKLRSASAQPGDRVVAGMTSDLIYFGDVIVPRNTRVIGHVTEAKRAIQPGDESRLGIVFDSIQLPHRKIQVEGTLRAFARVGVESTGGGCGMGSYSVDSVTPGVQEDICYAPSGQRIYYADPDLTVDNVHSGISSNTVPIELQPGDRLIINITAVK